MREKDIARIREIGKRGIIDSEEGWLDDEAERLMELGLRGIALRPRDHQRGYKAYLAEFISARGPEAFLEITGWFWMHEDKREAVEETIRIHRYISYGDCFGSEISYRRTYRNQPDAKPLEMDRNTRSAVAKVNAFLEEYIGLILAPEKYPSESKLYGLAMKEGLLPWKEKREELLKKEQHGSDAPQEPE